MSDTKDMIIGGGCFWCLEAVFQRLQGVVSVKSGYAGGFDENPNYKSVCNGTTGHAEVIKITFDQSIISENDLLKVFFVFHNPTTLNRQGNDVGTQYRSIIFYENEAHKAHIEKFIDEEISKYWDDPIVTQVVQKSQFFPAEKYHDDYFNQNGQQGYCQFVINPKVQKLKSQFSHLLK
jgi:peptide-methionine (S)-S-oxide reductase